MVSPGMAVPRFLNVNISRLEFAGTKYESPEELETQTPIALTPDPIDAPYSLWPFEETNPLPSEVASMVLW